MEHIDCDFMLNKKIDQPGKTGNNPCCFCLHVTGIPITRRPSPISPDFYIMPVITNITG